MTDATSATSATPTAVFVHGGWADATGFDGSIRALRDRGFAAIGVANPLRHLAGDAASLAALLGTISGPMILVGHSYGGAVISNAATGNQQVQALVFIAGGCPTRAKASSSSLSPRSSRTAWSRRRSDRCRSPTPTAARGWTCTWIASVPRGVRRRRRPETAAVMAATQRPWSGAAAATPSGPPGWRSIPSWYLLGTEDRAIPPAGQRFMAERGNAKIEEVAASHASMVSQPEAVTRLILSAVEATSRSRR
jgi:pimeloyl-ACP methyl ester carboxylesterase